MDFQKMKAVICTKYGPPEVLRITEVEKPIPKDHEVLIKIHVTTVHIGDTKIRSLKPGMGKLQDFILKPIMRIVIGFSGPRKKILGMELAGVIQEVGKGVSLFKPGDRVFATTEMNFGTYAEFTCIAENVLMVKIPDAISYEQAAPIPNGALTALIMIRKAYIKTGMKVLVYGASGSVGTFTVQLCVHFGATVVGVCSTANDEMVRSLGAEKTIDYAKEDFTESSDKYDVIFDAVGKIPRSDRKKALRGGGVYLNVLTLSNSIKLKVEDLSYLTALMKSGDLKAVIDRKYPLEKIVQAHRYVDKGHKKGNVVITI